MREATITVYKFEELSEKVQGKVIDKLAELSFDYDWWDFIYDDAKQVGIKINGFDIYAGYCKAEYTDSAEFTADAIIENHGSSCNTYKHAQQYQAERVKLDNGNNDDFDALVDDLNDDFLENLKRDYLVMLREEYDYIGSKEHAIEIAEANDYEFTADGEIFRN